MSFLFLLFVVLIFLVDAFCVLCALSVGIPFAYSTCFDEFSFVFFGFLCLTGFHHVICISLRTRIRTETGCTADVGWLWGRHSEDNKQQYIIHLKKDKKLVRQNQCINTYLMYARDPACPVPGTW